MSQAFRRHFESARPHCTSTACSTFAPHFGDRSASGKIGDRGPACGRNLPFSPCFISPSFSEICGSKFSKIFETALDRGDTIPVRNNSPALQQARVARENHLTSFPRKLENEVLRNPIKVPEGGLLHDRVPRLLLRAPRSMPPFPR